MSLLVCANVIIPTRKKNVPNGLNETNSKYQAVNRNEKQPRSCIFFTVTSPILHTVLWKK